MTAANSMEDAFCCSMKCHFTLFWPGSLSTFAAPPRPSRELPRLPKEAQERSRMTPTER